MVMLEFIIKLLIGKRTSRYKNQKLIPRRRGIPNYIAACRYCRDKNYTHNNPNTSYQNLLQNCINPRLVRSIRDQRLWYIENGVQIPNNIKHSPNRKNPFPNRNLPINNNNNGNNDGNNNNISQNQQRDNQDIINNIERLPKDIRARRQQIRDIVRNLFHTQNSTLNQELPKLSSLSEQEIINNIFKNSYTKSSNSANNMQNLIIHSNTSNKLGDAKIELGSSKNIEFITQHIVEKRTYNNINEEISYKKRKKFSCLNLDFILFEDTKFNNTTIKEQINIVYNRNNDIDNKDEDNND
ncbi:6506_t:CDS:2 [Gigaspora margarita]|uniref:6506_t:CDS:1 n=1 Tax=Gigaspora margarita TaxID=4874 RepID=A0ABN7V361_GIGMA|nr:6506_t:CDS:2 [Gigaspora margarita]